MPVQMRRPGGAANPPPGLVSTPRLEGASTLDESTVPVPTSVYRYYDQLGILIYVGITSRGVARNIEHNKSKVWWKYVARQSVQHFPTRAIALGVERRLIEKHRPPFNVQHNYGHAEVRAEYEEFQRGWATDPSLADVDPRKRLMLTRLSLLDSERTVAFRTFASQGDFVSRLSLGPYSNIPVSTPERPHAGIVADLTTAGQVKILHLRLKFPPAEYGIARATVKRLEGRGDYRIAKVLLNEERM